MNSDVRANMAWSAALFAAQVWPLCRDHVLGGELMQMEGRADAELARILDSMAGIDGWQIGTCGVRGIASRIQVGKNWRSFTIRLSVNSGARTEYEKRLAAIESCDGWMYPALTIQAYSQSRAGPIIEAGIAYTRDVIGYISAGYHYTKPVHNATFAVCDWATMLQRGYQVTTVSPTTETATMAKTTTLLTAPAYYRPPITVTRPYQPSLF
jgi:hypothetical protein